MNFLPSLDLAGSYQCVFGEDAYVEAQIVGENQLKCHLPRETSRPKIPEIPGGQDHISVPLKIWATATRQTVFEEQFIFYDCSSHRL